MLWVSLRSGIAALVLTSLWVPRAGAAPRQIGLDFDGIDDRVRVADSPTLDVTSAITVEAWIRPDSISNNKDQNRIVSKSADWELTTSTGDTGCGFGTAGHVQWRMTIGGVNARICGGSIVTHEWQHLAATYDGARVALYVNGIAVSSAARSGAITINTSPLALGNHPSSSRPFDGTLDEVRVWNRARAEGEIRAGMDLDLAGNEPGLIALIRCDEGSGQVAADGTASGNHGILGSSAGPDAADPLWVTSAPPSNAPPVVDAGEDRTIVLPDVSTSLSGSVTDDGLPGNPLSVLWESVSGPGPVVFGDPTAVSTSASFPAEGGYVLRLTASDGELDASDELTVTVLPEPTLASIVVTPNPAVVPPGGSQQFLAEGYDGLGRPFPIEPAWTATGGSIDAAGLYSATAVGDFVVTATDGSASGTASVLVRENTVPWPTYGWPLATPAEMGMDSTKLEQARAYALTGGGAGFITRHGRLVLSWGSATRLYDVKSVTKSIGSAALGLAIKNGYLGLADRAQQHLPLVGVPPESNAATGWLGDLTIQQLATHAGGFDKPGGYIRLLYPPGTAWAYSDGGANWLADVLTVKFGEDLRSVLLDGVFAPLGLDTSDFVWRDNRSREDTIDGIKRREFGAGISINVDAMARIGYLFLRGGQWEGVQVVPQSFVAAATSAVPGLSQLPVRNDTSSRFAGASGRYGLLWWNNEDLSLPGVPADAFFAWGLGDHLIVVIPSLDIVVSRTGSEWATSHSPSINRALAPFITPIAESVTQP